MGRRTTTNKTAEQVKVEQTEPMFSKAQILASAKYRVRRDAVDALLDDSKKYTMKQVDEIINGFMNDNKKGKVN